MPDEVAGSVYSLSIEVTAVPDSFTVLKNQIDTGLTGSIVAADTTSKSSGGVETAKALLKNLNITCTYNPDPADQAHIDLQAHFDAEPMTSFKIELLREDGVGKVAGEYMIVNFGTDGSNTDVIKQTLELAPIDAPTLT